MPTKLPKTGRTPWTAHLAPETIQGIKRMTAEAPGIRSQGVAVDVAVAEYWAKRDQPTEDKEKGPPSEFSEI